MITVSTTYRVIPERAERFEELFARLQNVLNHLEGHYGTRLYRDVESPELYMAISDWLDEHSYEKGMDAKPFRECIDWAAEGVLDGRIQFRIF